MKHKAFMTLVLSLCVAVFATTSYARRRARGRAYARPSFSVGWSDGNWGLGLSLGNSCRPARYARRGRPHHWGRRYRSRWPRYGVYYARPYFDVSYEVAASHFPEVEVISGIPPVTVVNPAAERLRQAALSNAAASVARQQLVQDLSSTTVNLRILAAQSLANYPDAASVVALATTVTNDPHPQVRLAAALSLATMRDPTALPFLATVRDSDPDPQVRSAAAIAIEQIEKTTGQ